jgi:hypothetical protein
LTANATCGCSDQRNLVLETHFASSFVIAGRLPGFSSGLFRLPHGARETWRHLFHEKPDGIVGHLGIMGPRRKEQITPPIPVASVFAMRAATVVGVPQISACSGLVRAGAVSFMITPCSA